ncbi:hypothetical protein FNV43_RR10120 [Rhamnella rubrinervis]|uniref:Uncharacterized protein n=1 Tax=Rhamnella rubrinervis TaxID=2594499 RepID=A0A8K0MKK9_9ROSA|nr:hypothetical protein FNV43_RR10120 [Rhamnella rubrinervis]
MGRPPCCDENGLKKGPWTPEEDQMLIDYLTSHGHGSWRSLPKLAGLNRCGKSCRLRWTNYLRPDIKRGKFSEDEERMIINLHSVLGNKWSRIATHLPGRTDNEIKNFWNTCLRKKLLKLGIDPETHKPRMDMNHLMNLSQLLSSAQFGNSTVNASPWESALKLQADAAQLAKLQLLQNLLQVISTTSTTTTSSLPHPDQINRTTSISGLLGSHQTQNLNPFLGLFSGTNTMVQNPGFVPQDKGSQVPVLNHSWPSIDQGGVDGDHDHLDFKTNISNYDRLISENPIPELVSPSPGTSGSNQMESNKSDHDHQAYMSAQSSPTSNMFEAWDKLMDDEASESYWKDILEYVL